MGVIAIFTPFNWMPISEIPQNYRRLTENDNDYATIGTYKDFLNLLIILITTTTCFTSFTFKSTVF